MNIMLLLEMASGAMGERVAVGSSASGLTYSELFQRAGEAAARLQDSGAERLVVCDESSPAIPLGLFAAAWAGLPYVPLNYRLPDQDLRSLAERSAPAFTVTDAAGSKRLASIDGIDIVLRDDFISDPGAGHASLESATWDMDPDGIALLLFTSGTTGPPKSAVLRHRHLVSYILGSVEFMGAAEDEATLVSVPPYHIAGVAAMLSAVYAGRRIVQLPKFDADAWIDLVVKEGVTHAMVVPTMLGRIVDALEARGGEELAGVRTLSYGGGKTPQPIVERALELFPNTDFVNAYGLTETSSTIAVLGPAEHREALASEDPSVRQRLTSVGLPLPTVEVSIRDEARQPVPTGTVGEIYVRGEQVSGEYLEQGSLLDDDSWFPTRDGGFLDADGYLFVQGRNDDVIIRGGENMSPGEIEDVLLQHPDVKEVAAIGVPSTEWGETVLVVVVPRGDPPDADELRELVRSRLRSSRVPTHIEFADELPFSGTGKLLGRVLRERYADPGDDAS